MAIVTSETGKTRFWLYIEPHLVLVWSIYSDVAQLVEQASVKREVVGSNPAIGAS